MALLLSPHRLVTDHIILESLHIIKNGKAIDFKIKELDSSELRKSYPELHKDAKDILQWFNKEGMRYTRDELERTYTPERVPKGREELINKNMLRRIYDLTARLKPFAPQVKWYHKIKGDKGNFRTAPCVFSPFKPQLAFEIVNTNKGLELDMFITLNGTSYPFHTFVRHHFLLENNNEYFLLAYKDYQTLEWLNESRPSQYAQQPEELSKQILARLEADYTVNRNGLFEANEIKTAPVKRVMLSEISNSFLVLTPQWLYEGFLMEGPWKPVTEVAQEGAIYSIYRHKEEEEEMMQYLESLHPNFLKQLNGYYYLSFADAQKKQWFLKVYHKLLELDVEVTGMDMLNHFRYSPHKVSTSVIIKEDKDNLLTIEMKICFGEEDVPLAELQKMLLAGQRAVLLKDGSLGVLGDEWMQQYGMIIKHGRVDKKIIHVARWMALSEQQSTDETQVLRPVLKKEWWKKWKQWQHSNDVLYPLPQGVQVQSLRPYQQKGYEWMRLLSEAGGSACLADDMGLGKTLQAICFMVSRLEENKGARHLVVCPTSLIYNWQQELQKFAPGVSCYAYHGAARKEEMMTQADVQVLITSYGTLRSDIDKMNTVSFDTIVVDESHNIKNPTALITLAVNQLQSFTRLALSGTPVMNNTFDLYAQLSFLLPGMFGNREFFKREYADAIDRNRDEEKIKALQKLTAPFILRRTKEQVAPDLPEKTESILWCEMGSDQRFAYESIKDTIRNNIFVEIKDKGLSAGKLSILNGIMKLRQACNSCELVASEEVFTSDSIKTQMLIEELKNITDNHKALVFSQFTSMLDLLERDLTKAGITYCRLDGSTRSAKRQELVNNFGQEDAPERVFLISLMAGNAGLNLTAADYVFLFDPWWNKAVEQQAIDRTHRIGQTKNVFAYKMVCKGTIEEKIITLQQRKSKLSQELIGGEEDGFVKHLTEEDVDFLFS